jgi:hypothetical protein
MTYMEALDKLASELGEPWTGTDKMARFDIARGPVHTAIDVIAHGGVCTVSVHTLPPHHCAGTYTNHLEFVAALLKGCQFKQWAALPGDLAKRHAPAPQFDFSD